MQSWVELSESGYWVFPTKDRRKFPTKFGGRKWDTFIKEKDHELLHAHLLHEKGTGAALCPQMGDIVPLLILDLDTYGMDFFTLWPHLAGSEKPNDNMLVIGSPSGGFHIWFRLPDEVKGDKLPATIDLGEGVTGEVRVSSKACRLIMLPGSLVTNKNGKPAKYQILTGSLNPKTLTHPPDSLMARLVARKGQGVATEPGNKPTEVMHFISLLERLDTIPEGDRNNFVARIGQILGRLHPGSSFDADLLSPIWTQLSPKLGPSFEQGEFKVALASGWSTGSKNGVKFQAREKHPTVTDVRAECEGVFGSIPWMVEVWDSTGKLKETLVGFGGSAKRRNEASRVATLKDLRDVLPTLTRLASASMDTVARSPLFVQPGWSKVLDFMMNTEKGVDHLGVPVEERFWETLNEWAKIAAGDLLFLEAWTEKRPPGSATPFIVWPLTEEQPPAIVLPPLLQETLLTQLGDIPKAKRLVSKHLITKTLVGMRSGQKVWVCPLSQLPTETQEYIGAQYEQFVQRKVNNE